MAQVVVDYISGSEESSQSTDSSGEESESSSSGSEQQVVKKAKVKPKDKNELPEIEIEDLELIFPNRICVMGASGSGKSTIIRNLVNLYLETGVVTGVWWFGSSVRDERLPKGHGEETINKAKIDKIRQMQRTPNMKKAYQIIVLDDILTQKFHQDKWWDGFISTCRHDRIILVLGLQYCKSISPSMRENFQQFICTSLTNQTVSALYSLSQNPDQWRFRKSLSGIKLGTAKLIDFRPSAHHEITNIIVPKCEAINYE
jgi:ABC-type glutathione transport system ATPase component